MFNDQQFKAVNVWSGESVPTSQDGEKQNTGSEGAGVLGVEHCGCACCTTVARTSRTSLFNQAGILTYQSC